MLFFLSVLPTELLLALLHAHLNGRAMVCPKAAECLLGNKRNEQPVPQIPACLVGGVEGEFSYPQPVHAVSTAR